MKIACLHICFKKYFKNKKYYFNIFSNNKHFKKINCFHNTKRILKKEKGCDFIGEKSVKGRMR